MSATSISRNQLDEQFTLQLACALQSCGVTAHRLEDAMNQVGRTLGLEVGCFASPTALLISIEGGRARLFRVDPAPFDLGRLVAIDAVSRAVATGSMSAADGARELARVRETGTPLSPVATLGSYGLVSTSAVAFTWGNSAELITAGLLGAGVGWILTLGSTRPVLGRLADGTAALFAATFAVLLAELLPISAARVTLSALIVLVPGLSLTLALAELSERHLMSGSARLAGVIVTFLHLGVGSAMGWTLGGLLADPFNQVFGPIGLLGPNLVGAAPLEPAVFVLAMGVAPLSVAVLFNARPRDYPVIFLSCWAGFFGTRLGGSLLGPLLGPFLGAFSVGLLGQAQSSLRGIPTTVSVVPGLLLLVPGSMGFGSFSSLLEGETVAGIDAGFSMFLVAASLVAGLLSAHAVGPSSSPAGASSTPIQKKESTPSPVKLDRCDPVGVEPAHAKTNHSRSKRPPCSV